MAVSAVAQTPDASIIGQVRDESGAVLPGAAVTATSPSLQVPSIVVVTNEIGEYRISPLPIGTYEVTYTLPGFGTVKQSDIRLTVGFVAKLDVVLKVGSLEENVTVSGGSPVVDVTSTVTSTRLTKETLELTPSTRNGVLSLMQQAPGLRGNLDLGGSNFSAIPSFSAYGQSNEQWSTLEGVLTQDPIGGTASGNYWDYSAFEETQVSAIGKGVEIPVRGVQLGAIVKTGGNDFHGSGFFSGTNYHFQSNNIDDTLRSQGITSPNTLEKQWDGSGDVGGRIVRDKLWFYVAIRRRELAEDVLGVSQPDGSPAVHTQEQRFGTVKLSVQANRANRFVAFFMDGLKTEEGNDVSLLRPWDSRTSGHVPTGTGKVGWQGVWGNLAAAAQYGHFYYNADYLAHAGGAPSTMDIITRVIGGDSTTGRTFIWNKRHHTNGTLTYFKSNGLLGNHEIKAGFDYMAEQGTQGASARVAGDYQLLFRNGAPFEINAYNSPNSPANAGWYLGTYVADNVTIGRRLTLNVGARYAYQPVWVPAQCGESGGTFTPAPCLTSDVRFKTFTSVAPRVSLAFDLTGKGRTVLKAGWGRFDTKRTFNQTNQANPFANTTTVYLWHDLNSNRLYEPGEVNLNTSGPDFVSQNGTANTIPDPNEPQEKENQYFLGLEHELVRDFSVRVTGIYANLYNVSQRLRTLRPPSTYSVTITKPDPGPDNVVGTADDPGTTLTYWDYPSAYAGAAFEQNMYTSPAGTPDQTFKTIEVAASKRLSRNWTFNASYSATKKHIPVVEFAFNDPNALYNTSDDNWEWIGRVSGAYTFPHGITASVNSENRTGLSQARTVTLTGGPSTPSLVVNAGPLGSLQVPAYHGIDARVEKAFRLAGAQKFTVRLNVYNLTNVNTILSWTTASGANFMKPSGITGIAPPRLIELSAQYSF